MPTANIQHKSVKDIWNERAEALIGKKIVEARYMTPEEVEAQGWSQSVIVLIFDDGSYVFPSMDDEGNNGGALFGSSEEYDFPVIRDY
jgi:hypothetical protein